MMTQPTEEWNPYLNEDKSIVPDALDNVDCGPDCYDLGDSDLELEEDASPTEEEEV